MSHTAPQATVCRLCSSRLSTYNPGKVCSLCQARERNRLVGESSAVPYYTLHDIMSILGLDSEEQARRLGRRGVIPGRLPGIKAHHYYK